MTNVSGTYYFQYTDLNGVPHTVHGMPKGQLESTIRSFLRQGFDKNLMKVWQGTTLHITDFIIIVGGEEII